MPRRPLAGPLTRAFAWLVIRLRWLIVAGWIAAAVAATLLLPSVSRSGGPAVGDLVPVDAEAVEAEVESFRRFRVPLLSRIAVVQRDSEGLTADAQARVFSRSIDLLSGGAREDGLLGSLPVTNSLGLFPASREDGTTAITYLFFHPNVELEDEVDRARAYIDREFGQPDDAVVGLTGAIPARVRQTDIILDALPWVEAGTVALVALILVLYFRGLGAPLVTLGAAAVAYLVSIRVVAWSGERLGIAIPRDLEPVIVVLLLGIVTDYSIFFLSGYRSRLAAGESRVRAAEHSTADFVPIILTAGLIVAAGSGALLAASVGFLRAFGPGLALTVLVCLVVSITLIPAALAILGRALFWPRRFPKPARDEGPEGPRETARTENAPRGWRAGVARALTRRPVAAVAALVSIGLLLAAGSGLLRTELGFTLINGLPEDSEERRASEAVQAGFAPGILSPTELLVTGSGLGDQRGALGELGDLLARYPRVAGVIGPTEELGELDTGLFVAEDGTAARFILILDRDPLGDDAIDVITALRRIMPDMLARAGLSGVDTAFAGDTALAAEAVDRMLHDLSRIAVVAVAVDLVLLMVFLRGFVAPLYLLVASALGLAAALGLTTYLFQDVLGRGGLTYYVPFGTAILLLSLGSDYNVFVVGRIWDEAKVRPLREAVAVAAPRAARTITIAGVVLAVSFSFLATVPLIEFREFAFAMAAGVLIDTFLVRSILVPSLITLFGRMSWWPGRGFAPGRRTQPAGEPVRT